MIYKRCIKLKFLNSLFDIDNNDEVDRLEFRNLISSFIERYCHVNLNMGRTN